MERNELTQQLVKQLFDYDECGFLIWKVSIAKARKGGIAGHLKKDPNGVMRYCVRIEGISFYTSRIIFLWHKGYLPGKIDHQDRNMLNNQIENLRACTDSQNMMNRAPTKGSSSKYKGVSYVERNNNWRVQIMINYKTIKLGIFNNENEAALAYNEAAIKYHGEFAYLNIIEI